MIDPRAFEASSQRLKYPLAETVELYDEFLAELKAFVGTGYGAQRKACEGKLQGVTESNLSHYLTGKKLAPRWLMRSFGYDLQTTVIKLESTVDNETQSP